MLLHNNISPLIQSQFPSFYREDGPLFVTFVEEYYKWLESTGNPLYHSRHLLEYRDIDNTIDEFLPHFQSKYLVGTPTNTVRNQRDLIKHSKDIYQSKGTVESLRLMFQMLFGQDIEVYYPGDDILRTSDGVWISPKYLELSITDRSRSLIGKDVVGSVSNARAFVERIDRRNYNGRIVDVAYISNVRYGQDTGTGFVYGELISDDGIVAGAPKVVGSLTRVGITSAGAGFELGQIVDVVSDRRGIEGKARVTQVGNHTGEVNYVLEDGGYGYTLNTSNVIISSNVLSITSFTSSNSAANGFPRFGTVIQPLANLQFNTANVVFGEGDLVYGVNSTSGVLAAGFVMTANQYANSGWLLLSPHNIATLTIDTVTLPDANTGSFEVGDYVYQYSAVGNTAVGSVVEANSTTLIVDQLMGPFVGGTLVAKYANTTANVSSVSTQDLGDFTNTSITSILVGNTLTGAVRTGSANLTATANIVGSNVSAIGVTTINRRFIGGSHAWVYCANSDAVAEVTVTSSGIPGGFKLGSISNTENIIVNTDLLNGVGVSNTPYLSLNINAASYGFPADPTAGYESVIGTTWTKENITIGTISTLTQRNPGVDNTAKPFVVEIQKTVAAYGKHSVLSCTFANATGTFVVGEILSQSVPLTAVTLDVGAVSGDFNYSTREYVKQVRADGATVYGELYLVSVTANTGQVSLFVANSSNTFDTSNTILGLDTGVTASVTGVTPTTFQSTATGTITQSTTQSVTIRRSSFQDFALGGSAIYGSDTGTTATITSLQADYSSDVIGDDAIVDPLAGIADGTIESVDVVDSGVFYEHGETVSLVADGNQTTAYGVAYVEKSGVAQGYWQGDRGTLDSTNRIQDNQYYQEYSYEIQSGIDRIQYESSVKSLIHVAGTRMFSKYVGTTVSHEPIQFANTTYDKTVTLTLSSAPTGTFGVGDVVYQSNSTANIAVGVVSSFNSAINTLQVVYDQGAFVASGNVHSTTGAQGTIASLNITLY